MGDPYEEKVRSRASYDRLDLRMSCCVVHIHIHTHSGSDQIEVVSSDSTRVVANKRVYGSRLSVDFFLSLKALRTQHQTHNTSL